MRQKRRTKKKIKSLLILLHHVVAQKVKRKLEILKVEKKEKIRE